MDVITGCARAGAVRVTAAVHCHQVRSVRADVRERLGPAAAFPGGCLTPAPLRGAYPPLEGLATYLGNNNAT